MSKSLKIFFFLIAVFLLSIVIYDMYLWIIISVDESKSFEQVKKEYHEKLPDVFSKRFVLEFFNISLLLVSAYLFFKCRRKNFLKLLSTILFGLSLLLAYWNLFSLM